MSQADSVPDGYHSVTPYLVVERAAALIEFLRQAFGATLLRQMVRPDGTIGHTELRIGDSMIMLGQASGPHTPTSAALHLYVKDSDATYQRACDAGAKPMMPPANMPYGDRMGGVIDPAGNTWWIATRIEEVPADEAARRMGTKLVTE